MVGHFILNQIFKNVEKGQGSAAPLPFTPVAAPDSDPVVMTLHGLQLGLELD